MALTPIAHVPGSSQLAGSTYPQHVLLVDTSGNPVSFGSGGTSAADQSAFTVGTSLETPAGGLYEAVPTSLTDGQTGVVGLTAKRAIKTTLYNSSGTEITSFGGATPAGTSALANVAESATSVTALAANSSRLACELFNDSDSAVNVKCGATASATSFTKRMLPRERWGTADIGSNYTGKFDAIWDTTPGTSGHAAMRSTELTA